MLCSSQKLLQGVYCSQHAFPLTGHYFKQGREYRKEWGLKARLHQLVLHVFASLLYYSERGVMVTVYHDHHRN